MSIDPLIAFGGGVVSFLSPCVLPLIPVYISLVTGYSVSDSSNKGFSTLGWSLLFVLGFTITFVTLGASATFVGDLLNRYYIITKRVVGVILIFWALIMLGVFKIGFFNKTFQPSNTKTTGFWGALFTGVAFGLTWSPCVGPILLSILSMAAVKEKVWQGMLLLFFYSLGIAVPFLIVAFSVNRAIRFFRKIQAHYRKIEVLTAVVILIFGIYLISGGMF